MKNPDTPLGILFTVALLVIYAGYAVLLATVEKSPMIAAVGTTAAIAAVGAALLKPWSRFIVYALAPAFVAKFAYSVRAGVAAGYFNTRFDSLTHAAVSLIPGLLMSLMVVACCFIVHRHLAPRAAPTGPDAD
jgi:hypothetical protein